MTSKSQTAKIVDGREQLSAFREPREGASDFVYFRFYWKGDGPKCGVADAIIAKTKPRGHEAYWYEVLLPDNASGRYKHLDQLLTAYDSTLLQGEKTAYSQFTITLDPAEAWPKGWEQVRAWALHDFVRQSGLAVVLVHHVPELAGSPNAPHMHVIVLPRKLTVNGFGLHVPGICTDDGYQSAKSSWLAWYERGEVTRLQ